MQSDSVVSMGQNWHETLDHVYDHVYGKSRNPAEKKLARQCKYSCVTENLMMFHYILPVDLPMAYQSYLSMVFFYSSPFKKKKLGAFQLSLTKQLLPTSPFCRHRPHCWVSLPDLRWPVELLMLGDGWEDDLILGKPNKDRNVIDHDFKTWSRILLSFFGGCFSCPLFFQA